MEFIQFLRPDGRRKQITIERPEEIEKLAEKCVEAGVRFEAEVLRTNDVSFTAELDDENGDVIVLGHEICPNAPGEEAGLKIKAAVDEVVRRAAVFLDTREQE